jgi:hypothetical protein
VLYAPVKVNHAHSEFFLKCSDIKIKLLIPFPYNRVDFFHEFLVNGTWQDCMIHPDLQLIHISVSALHAAQEDWQFLS